MNDVFQSLSITLLPILQNLWLWVGGSGGLLVLWDKYKYRTRVRIDIIDECDNKGKNVIEFEAENLGQKPTSMKRYIYLKGVTPKKQIRNIKLEINTSRALAPLEPKRILAKCTCQSDFSFLLLRSYKFSIVRGGVRNVYKRDISKNSETSLVKYTYELLYLKFFGDFLFCRKDEEH